MSGATASPIANGSDEDVQLLARYWASPTASAAWRKCGDRGVVGEQPELSPGDSFQYTSGCPLKTSSGIMQGSYTMRSAGGQLFEVGHPRLLHWIFPGARAVRQLTAVRSGGPAFVSPSR